MSYTIIPDNQLIRRVPELPSHVEQDQGGNFVRSATGELQLTSGVFKYSPAHPHDGVSVDVLEIWLETGTYAEALDQAAFRHFTRSGAGHLAAILPAAVPLAAGLACEHDPVPAGDHLPANPAHALILGEISKTLARKLAKACRLEERPAA